MNKMRRGMLLFTALLSVAPAFCQDSLPDRVVEVGNSLRPSEDALKTKMRADSAEQAIYSRLLSAVGEVGHCTLESPRSFNPIEYAFSLIGLNFVGNPATTINYKVRSPKYMNIDCVDSAKETISQTIADLEADVDESPETYGAYINYKPTFRAAKALVSSYCGRISTTDNGMNLAYESSCVNGYVKNVALSVPSKSRERIPVGVENSKARADERKANYEFAKRNAALTNLCITLQKEMFALFDVPQASLTYQEQAVKYERVSELEPSTEADQSQWPKANTVERGLGYRSLSDAVRWSDVDSIVSQVISMTTPMCSRATAPAGGLLRNPPEVIKANTLVGWGDYRQAAPVIEKFRTAADLADQINKIYNEMYPPAH